MIDRLGRAAIGSRGCFGPKFGRQAPRDSIRKNLENKRLTCYSNKVIGMSPSGKAPGSGPGIRGFESLHPSQA